MNVIFAVGGQIIVDNAGHLLHINASGQQVGGDEHARRAGTELAHDHLALALVHVAVHGGHGEVALVHRLCQPVHLKIKHLVTCVLAFHSLLE